MTAPAAPRSAAPVKRDAAARLYIEYRERIYRFCLSRLRSREEAEDAVQNVFMRVHTALDRGVVPQFEAAWLYKIAHNVCLSRAESTSRRTSMEALSSFDDDEFPVAAPEVSSDELAGLNEALEAMPNNLRTALLLREWQGLSYAEVADPMGLSVSAVETLIFRARRHLADALEHPGKKRTPVARLLDLLGLGWLRNVLLGVGPAAKLAAGAALLALGGGPPRTPSRRPTRARLRRRPRSRHPTRRSRSLPPRVSVTTSWLVRLRPSRRRRRPRRRSRRPHPRRHRRRRPRRPRCR